MISADSNVTVSVIFSAIAAIGVIYSILRGRKSDNHEDVADAVERATEFTKLNVKLDVLSQQFSDLIRSNEKTSEKLSLNQKELQDANSRINLLFEYKDNHEARLQRLEGGERVAYSERKHSES